MLLSEEFTRICVFRAQNLRKTTKLSGICVLAKSYGIPYSRCKLKSILDASKLLKRVQGVALGGGGGLDLSILMWVVQLHVPNVCKGCVPVLLGYRKTEASNLLNCGSIILQLA